MSRIPRITLHKGKEISVIRKHPWIFSGAIRNRDDGITEGEIVEVFSSDAKYLATGYYAGGSIAVRIISYEQSPIDLQFWLSKIEKAKEYRRLFSLPDETTNVYRLFFGEGDGVPGLIIDAYDGHLVIQAHSEGIYRQLPLI